MVGYLASMGKALGSIPSTIHIYIYICKYMYIYTHRHTGTYGRRGNEGRKGKSEGKRGRGFDSCAQILF